MQRLKETPMTIDFHAGPVSCVDMRADGTVASGGYDATVRLWSAAGRPEGELRGHRALVNGVRFSPDGARVASASSDHTARVFDAASGACLALLEGHRDDVNAVAWSPEGRRVATASFDGTARIHAAASGALLAVCAGHEADVNGVAWSPDGGVLATASDDRTVRLFAPDGAPRGALRGHTDWVDGVAFSPDGKLLASASLDRSVRVWDVASGACVAVLGGHGCTVKAVAWSPDGERLATAAYDKRIRIFARGIWAEVAALRDTRMWNRSLAWGQHGTLATGSFGRAPVRWRVGEENARTADRLGTPGINALALSPDGRLAALACDDGGARIVELATGRILRERFDHEGAVLSAAWSPDGGCVAFGGWDDRVALYGLAHSAPLAWIPGDAEPVNALAFSRDGRTLALGGFMGTVSVWDAASGAPLGRAGRHEGSVKSVAALPGGGWLSSGRDGYLRVHADPASRAIDENGESRAIQVGPTIVNGVAVDPSGRRAACVSRSRGVEVFDLAKGVCLASYRGHACSARTVAFAPDGASVAAGYYDGTLLLWDPAGAPKLARPFGAVPLSTVAFAPGGGAVVVATWDPHGRFGIVDVANGEAKSAHALARSWR
jgi:WD40 repeat protein